MPGARRRPGVLALAVLIPFLSGCTLLPLGGRPTGSPGGVEVLGGALTEYRVVFHCHSLLSHDSEGSFETIAESASKLGIDAVLLTDHYARGNIARSPRGFLEGVLFVPGLEIHGNGSLLAAGVKDDVDPSLATEEIASELERQGAFLVAGHVEELEPGDDFTPYGGFEVYNLHAEFRAASPWALAARFLFYPVDPFFQAAIGVPERNIALWDRLLLEGHRLAPLAGHDAHANVRVFGPLGGTIGTYAEIFRLFSTRVLAEELSEPALLEALRRGRTYVIFDYLSREGGFELTYGPEGVTAGGVYTIGDEAPWSRESLLRVTVPGEGTLRLIRNGRALVEKPIETAADRSTRFRIGGPGIYRVEVHRSGRLWILSGPIYLRAEGEEEKG